MACSQVSTETTMHCASRTSNRFGWKAIPFALDDFDSNYKIITVSMELAWRIRGARTCLGEHVRRGLHVEGGLAGAAP